MAGSTSVRQWLVGSATRTEPLRLYCFPHGGGSVAEYLRWSGQLPGVEVWAVQLPGRGSRIDEPPVPHLEVLATTIADQVPFAEPYAFFGHSFGALLCFEVARALRASGRALPVRLFASGYPAPDLPLGQPPIQHLPDQDFLAEISRRHDALPEQVLQDADLRAAVLPGLRMDYRALEDYRFRIEPSLPFPITAVAGADDAISRADLDGWQRQCEPPVSVCRLPGGHFYLHDRRDRLLRTVAAQLRAAISAKVDSQC